MWLPAITWVLQCKKLHAPCVQETVVKTFLSFTMWAGHLVTQIWFNFHVCYCLCSVSILYEDNTVYYVIMWSLVFSKKQLLRSKGKGKQHIHWSVSQVNEVPLKFSCSFTKAHPSWHYSWPTVSDIFCEYSVKDHGIGYLLSPSSYPPPQNEGFLPDTFPAVLSEVVLQVVLDWVYDLWWQ